MPILYENPDEVGADRILNAIAAYEMFGREARRPLVVCDFGTATTLDAVTAKGEYLGGAICPGVTISADALFQRAARLPRVDVRKPPTVIGRTTVGAMESGLFYGYVEMVEGLVRRMSAELGGNALCVATGGLAATIAQRDSCDRTGGPRPDAPRAENGVGTQPVDYCREIEAYLCRKNDGHLIRVVGPSFELVSALGGRRRSAEDRVRGHRSLLRAVLPKGPRRRPVRIDFCDADVRDVFDEWRRAVGVASRSAADGEPTAAEGASSRRPSLPAHLERAAVRLSSARATGALGAGSRRGHRSRLARARRRPRGGERSPRRGAPRRPSRD